MSSQQDPAIRARGLVKRYGDLIAVDGLDVEVPRGSCLGLLGPNGAGKTTTIEMLEGLKAPDAGELAILGLDWARDAREIRSRIGVQLQETDLLSKLTVAESVRMFQAFYADTRSVDEVLDIVGLQEKRAARVDVLSGGQKQRLALGCALVHRPEILFLDEPTTGLDPQARRRVWEVIEDFVAAGGTVLLTTHYMEEAERLSQRVLIVDHGRAIASGSPREVIERLGVENIVELRLSDERADIDDATLTGLPGVGSVVRDNGLLRLSVTRTQACLSALLALLGERGLAVEDLRTHRPTLEDVFVTLTGKHLRDG